MNDLIDREEALTALRDTLKSGGKSKGLRPVTFEMIWAIKSLPSAEPKWIPVTERLPEKNGLYLVTYVNGEANIDFSFFRMKKWHGLVSGEWTDCWYPVTAWMPLPEPYEGGDAE